MCVRYKCLSLYCVIEKIYVLDIYIFQNIGSLSVFRTMALKTLVRPCCGPSCLIHVSGFCPKSVTSISEPFDLCELEFYALIGRPVFYLGLIGACGLHFSSNSNATYFLKP